MVDYKLTGKKRYRVRSRFLRSDVVVLQVEVHATGYYMENSGGRVESRDIDSCTWRDARITDITGETE